MQAPQTYQARRPARVVALPPVAPTPETGLSIKDFVGIIRRRRTVVLLTMVLITTLSAVLAYQLTPRYTATVRVMIKPSNIQVIDLQSVVREVPPDRLAVETEIDVIRSEAHAQRVVESLDLLSDAELNPFLQPAQDVQPSMLATIREWIGRDWLTTVGIANQLSDGPMPPETKQAEVEDEEQRHRHLAATARQVLRNMQVGQSPESYVISINYTSTDPKKAARIANAIAELYVSGQRQEKVAATTDAASWLSERVEQLRQAVLKSDRAVEEYRAAHEIVGGRQGSLGEQELSNLNLQLLTAQAERAEREARLLRAREVRNSRGGYETLAEVMGSPIIVNLRQQETALLQREAQLSKEYGPAHPRMLEIQAEKQNLAAKIDAEVGKIVANLENEVAVARSREEALAKALEEAKQRSAVISQAEIELRQLEREADANRSLYQDFLRRLKQTAEQLDLIRPDAKIVSPAVVPQEPSFPKPRLMIAVGFTSSAMLGVLLALLRERLDSAFRTERQLHEVLGLPSFGVVPAVRRSRRRPKPHRYLLEKPLSAYADAIRSVQKCVELAGPDRQSQVVLVTSTLPGEGKTTLALSLAASTARSGRKTILIEVDLRRPSIAREMEQPCGAGLVEYLNGEATGDEIIHVAEFQPNLHFIPVTGLTASPVDLLESQEMATLLMTLRARYDYIFLDAPPALVTDARAAALLADTVLYAVQWDKTTVEIASQGLQALASNGITVSGLVLTQVDLVRQARYGYGDAASYYREYNKYCEA